MLSKNKKNTHELRRVDPSVLKNIVMVIHENNSIRKTPLMGKTNLDYSRLNSYLNWLKLLDFVQIKDNNVILTENGLKFSSRCLK